MKSLDGVTRFFAFSDVCEASELAYDSDTKWLGCQKFLAFGAGPREESLGYV
jgi:hypothetical protein